MSAPHPQTDEQIAKWNQLLASDKTYRRLYDAWRAGFNPGDPFNATSKKTKAQLDAYLRANGVDPSQQGLEIDASNGQLKRDHTVRNALLTTAAIVGGGYGASFLPGVGLTGGTAATTAATTAAPTAAGVSGGLTAADIVKKIALAGIPAVTAITTRKFAGNNGNGGDQTPGSQETSAQIREALGIALKRIADQQPLQDAVNRQALGGLPTYAKQGGA